MPRNGSLQNTPNPTRLSDANASSTERPGTGSPAGTSGPLSGPASAAGASTYSSEETDLTDEFGLDGFLNLPPPPSMGMDGKTSVLVRPGQAASASNVASASGLGPLPVLDRIKPPSPPNTGPLNLEAPLRANTASNGGGLWQPPVTDAPAGSGFPHNGNGSTFPPSPTNWGSPGSDERSAPPGDRRGVRPVLSPADENGSPNPILGNGRSEVLPPGARSMTSHVAAPPPRSPEQATDGNIDRDPKPPKQDLLASVADRGAAVQKPTLDQETADELMEPAKPWRTLVLTSMALFASLAANVYLGWVALGIYRRYREVAAQLHRFQASMT